jgi:hypothetical protein
LAHQFFKQFLMPVCRLKAFYNLCSIPGWKDKVWSPGRLPNLDQTAQKSDDNYTARNRWPMLQSGRLSRKTTRQHWPGLRLIDRFSTCAYPAQHRGNRSKENAEIRTQAPCTHIRSIQLGSVCITDVTAS